METNKTVTSSSSVGGGLQKKGVTTTAFDKQEKPQKPSPEQTFFKTLYRQAGEVKSMIQAVGVAPSHSGHFDIKLLTDPKNSSPDTSQMKRKSLPNIKIASKSQSQSRLKERPCESGIGRIYKGIFTPGVGRMLGTLQHTRYDNFPRIGDHVSPSEGSAIRTDAFLTARRARVDDPLNLTLKASPKKFHEESGVKFTSSSSKLRAATDKLIEKIMDSSSHSLRNQFLKFVETGDRKHMFYCECCPHCRLLNNDFYAVKQRMIQRPPVDEYFFDYFDLNARLKSLKEFQHYADSFATSEPDSQLFLHFLDSLLDRKIVLAEILDPEMLAELKKSLLYRGIPLEEDCRRFVEAVDKSFAQKSTVPIIANSSEKAGPETTFGRFYERCIVREKIAEVPGPEDSDYSSVVYLTLQELIKQLCGGTTGNKEKAYVLLKAFRKLAEESEKKWFAALAQITQYSLRLKSDLEFLLGKSFMDSRDIKTVMENNDLTAANLAEHKHLLQSALGAFYTEESKRVEAETRMKRLEQEVEKWLVDWKILHQNDSLNERLNLVSYEMAKKQAEFNPEYRRASEEEKALMMNAERFMLVLPYKNRWEVEKQKELDEKRKLRAAQEKLKEDFAKLEADLASSVHEKMELEKALAKAKSDQDYVWNKLNIPPTIPTAIQTEVSLHDLCAIQHLDKILSHKCGSNRTHVQKTIDRISRGLIEVKTAASDPETYLIICWLFTHLVKVRPSELKDASIHEMLYQILLQKYGTSEAKDQCARLVLGLKRLARTDERVNFVSEKIVGVVPAKNNGKYMMAFYVGLVKATGLHVDEVMGENSKLTVSLSQACGFFARTFENVAKKRHLLTAKRGLVRSSALFLNGERQHDTLTEPEKLRYMYIHDWEAGIADMCKKPLSELFQKYSNGTSHISAAELALLLLQSSTTPLEEGSARDAVEVLFPGHRLEGKCFEFEEIDKLFYWKIRFEVPLRAYLSMGVETAEIISMEMRGKVEEMYANYDKDEDKKLTYYQFLQVLEDRKKKKAKWEMLAMYEEAKEEDGDVHFDDLLYKLLINPGLKTFFDEQ